MANYDVQQFDSLPPIACPCGEARRAFAGDQNHAVSVHLVEITNTARRHYHKKMTEVYIILEGSGVMELDDDRVEVKPLMAIYIRPGCRHRAVGNLRILNIAIPSFDPADEFESE